MSWNYLLSQWWLVPGMGVTAALVALFVGRRLLGRPKRTASWITEAPAAIDPFINPPPGERRLAARRGGNSVEVDLLDPEGNVPPVNGWVVNRSQGGLCLEVERALTEGTTVKIKVRNRTTDIEPLGVVVKCCRLDGAAWQLNCQFVNSPSFNTLLMFG